MNILITSAGSELARNLAGALAQAHTLRLTELYPVEDVEGTFVQSELGHDESTNELVRSMDTIIHIAEIPSDLLAEADQPENYAIDYETRCTYNLLMAAVAEGVKHFVYASTLRLFEQLQRVGDRVHPSIVLCFQSISVNSRVENLVAKVKST